MATASAQPTASPASGRALRPAHYPFLGLIDSVIVERPADYEFDGAILRGHAEAAWIWMTRDLGADLVDIDAVGDNPVRLEALEALIPELLTRAKTAVAEAKTSATALRRVTLQLGSDEAWARMPNVLNAVRCRGLLEKAQGFGRAANSMTEDAPLALAFQSMPLNDPSVCSLLMMAAVGQVANPTRMITAAIRIAGSATEGSMSRAGFAPLIDAIFAHAQNQVPLLAQSGPFGDIDLVCRALDRFHRLMRAVTGYVELNRNSRWSMIAAALTKVVSNRIEPMLRDVGPDLNKALRRRDTSDRLDSDQLLAALNGVYLLATVRDSRDSLALNAIFEQAWAQVGQALEIHIDRAMTQLRQNPTDAITSARLDAAVKMAEVRFNAEYADVLRRAKEVAERRAVG